MTAPSRVVRLLAALRGIEQPASTERRPSRWPAPPVGFGPRGSITVPTIFAVLGAIAITVVVVTLVRDVRLPKEGVLVNRNTNAVACTQEAKLCPDGSAVGRTGPNCEFAECPGTNGNANSSLNENSSTNANASDPTAGWRTYTNSTYGYSIKYSPDLTAGGTSSDTTFQRGDETGPIRRVSILSLTQSNHTGLEQSEFSGNDGWYAWALAGFPSSGYRAAKYSTNVRSETYGDHTFTVTNYDPASSWGGAPMYYLVKNETVFLIIDQAGAVDQQVTKTMLATLTLTDPTAGWKTYTNSTYGYGIRYPSNWPLDSKNIAAVVIGTVPFEPGPGSLGVNVYLSKTVAQRLKELKTNYLDGCTAETSVQVSGSVGTALQCRGAFAGEPHEFTLVAQGSNAYEITYISGSTATDPTMKQVLSTFRFTE